MKRLSLFLTILVTMLHAHLHAATFTASQIEITPGQTAQLVIGMNNTEANLSGFQFKLYLPEGLSVTTNDQGEFVYTKSGRIANHAIEFRGLNDGGYLVIAYSMNADVITGSSGELMSISVTADEAASATENGTLSNIRVTDVSSNTSSCNDVPIDVTFAPNIIDFADANVKAICVANWDTNGDGELDEAEAAAVTGLGTVFRDNQTITSFNELQYFTGLTSISDYAFRGCSGLTSVTIPGSVTSIGEYAFVECSGLTSIKVEEGNTVFDSRNNCNAIIETATNTLIAGCQNTIIPESVTSIGDRAFYCCLGLTSVAIPEGVTSIGDWAFSGCSGLISIKVEEGNTEYDSRDNCNAIIETKSNMLVAGCMNTVIPNSVVSIGDGAFLDCDGLTSITIPGILTSIGNEAFSGCSGLTEVYCYAKQIPNTPGDAFSNTNIKDVTLYVPKGSIESYKTTWPWSDFGAIVPLEGEEDPDIKTIHVAEAGTLSNYISDAEKYSLQELTITGQLNGTDFKLLREMAGNDYKGRITGGRLQKLNLKDASIVKGGDNYLETDRIYTGSNAWFGFSFVEAVIDRNDEMGVRVFCGCKLTEIILPQNLKYIDEAAFAHCDELTSVVMSEGLVSIGESAFMQCGKLLSISIPRSVSSIGRYAFAYNNFSSVELPDITVLEECVFYQCKSLASVTIPESMTRICDDVFRDCSSLTSITIPKGVTSIGYRVFGGCSSLISIKVDEANRRYDSRNGCNAIIETATNTLICGIQNTAIPESVTGIGDYAFRGCTGLTSITIPGSVTRIGFDAFYDTAWYDDQPNGVVYAGKVAYKYKGTMPANTEIILDEGTLGIAGCAFYECSGLISISIPNSVTNIGRYAFQDCSGLTSVNIPNSVTNIGDNAFYGCSGLTIIDIPKSVANIGYEAFSGCNGLTEVYCYAKQVPNTGSNAFSDTNIKDATLYVPKNSAESYKAASPWNGFGTIVGVSTNDVIDFADANVKAICVANWDTNGDGELDEAEAAAVTDLGEVFQGNQTITSFNELQYFTGLTSIGKYAFEHCRSLTSVTIPNSVITIGESAFHYCEGLTSLTIPESVASIGEYAFFVCSGLTSLTIPESVTNIKPEAFGGCDGLTSIKVEAGNTIYDSRNDCNAIIETSTNTLITGCQNTVIPNSVTRIGKVAFYGCSGLTSVTIPNSVTSISYFAFFDCECLTSLTIPESVTSVESSAVVGCSGLTSIKVETGNTKYDSRNDCNAIIETASNKLIAGCQNTVIPNSVTAIDQNAFNDCIGLTSLTIPNSVTSIGGRAFCSCSSLTSVTIGNSVTSIGIEAFKGCSVLKDFYCYAENVPNTSSDVFDNWSTGTATLHVPASSIDKYKTTEPWSSFGTIVAIEGEYANIQFADANVKAICVANWDTNGDGELDEAEAVAVTDLGDVFFNNQTITSFNELQYFTELTSIGNNAFYCCTNLTSVIIPDGVTSISYGAFWDCYRLTSITIPESVISIGEDAFGLCDGLTSITIPGSVTSIGEAAFCVCPSLSSIKVDESNTVYDSRDNCNAIIETKSNTLVSGCMNTVIPGSVTSIGNYAFDGCSGLTSITIPVCVTSIGDYAFSNCSGLTSITIPGSVTSIGEYAFLNCRGLTSLTIPESVTSIGGNPFSGCDGLTSIKVDEGNTVYDSRDNCNAIIETKSNTLVSGFINTIIPNSVTSIGAIAFDSCFGLTSITIPESVTSIGDYAFFNCDGLTSVTIPDGVTSIGDDAFAYCYHLTNITTYIIEPFAIADDVFENIPYETATLYVPAGTIDAYRATDGWKNFQNIEEIPSNNIIDFADANVKALCVANWDTNGDGELDEAEAAAVTDLGPVFKDNKTITSFNELQYFTGLTSIGSGAFYNCLGLTSVTIPESVTNIGYYSFAYCKGLTSIAIPESVTTIGRLAFYLCDGLTSITIPGSVTSIASDAFGDCSGLTSINVEAGNTKYDSRNNCNAIIETATNTLIAGCQNTVIPNSVTSIGEYAFYGCSGLTSITIPGNVTSIGNYAFNRCHSLTSITIPESVTSIGEEPFCFCHSLTSIKVEEGNTVYDSRDNCNAIIETNSNTLVAGCINTVIPNNVTSIGGGAFTGCTGLTSITIPESVTSIGNEAFWYCTSLTNITTYIEEPFAIADNVFEGIPYETATLFVPGGTIDAYRATDGWKNFQNIEVIPQQLTIAVVGDGTVTFSGETLTNTTATFTISDEVQLLLAPDEGCHIERVMVNQQDWTSEVTDGVLTLNVTGEDYFVLVEFQHDTVEEPNYVTYTIYIDGPGDVRVKDAILTGSENSIQVLQGGDLVIEFLPDEGQMVGKVTWNGETVTEQALGNTFVVRDVQEDGTVSVIFMERMETFVYAGIRYGVTDDIHHIVKVLPYDYSGHLSVPESFDYSQRTWQVQEIGSLAFSNSDWLVSVKIPASIVQTGKNLFKRDTRLAAIQWDAQLPLRTEVTGELTNANMLYYVKDSSYAPQGGNVVVNGMADNISLSDGHDFYCPEAFKAKKVAYSHIYKMLTRRGYCQGWETLVLPFDVATIRLSRNPDNPEIFPYESLTDDDKVDSGEALPFWLYNYNDNDTFTPAASIEANTPYIISMPNDAAYLPVYRLAGTVTFSAQSETGVDVLCTADENLQTPGTGRRFHPSYQRQVMGNDCYLVNVNDSVNHQFAEGSKFIQALRPSRPFEAYMVSQTSYAKPWYDIFEQMSTDIQDVRIGKNESADDAVYDLSGRKLSNGRLSNRQMPSGIYIIDHKKRVIK